MPRNVLDTVRADFDPKLERCVVSVDAKLNDGLKVKTKHQTSSGFLSSDLVAKNWKVGYDFGKKTVYGEYEHKFEAFEFKVKQRVPDFNWSVIPSPELQVETKLVERPDFSDSLQMRYDMSKRLAVVEEKLKIGKKNECVVFADNVDRLQGASIQWKTIVGHRYMKTVSGKFSAKKGPVVTCTADPIEHVGVKLEAGLSKVVKGEVTFKNFDKDGKVEWGVNFQRAFSSAEKPRTGIFVKWKFS